MSTTEEHVREAERFAASAEEWMVCLPSALSDQERIWRRSADLQAAQVHATLAQTLKAAELMPMMARIAEWITQPEAPVPAVAPQSAAAGESCCTGCGPGCECGGSPHGGGSGD
jgi:hypothetical protein